MSPKFKINLADEVEDILAGFKGRVAARSQNFNSCNRVYVQPKVAKDGKLPEAFWFDEPSLKVIKRSTQKFNTDTWIHDLGAEAESTITGFKGTITSRFEHINGCNRYHLQPKVGKDKTLPEGYYIEEYEIKVTKAAPKPPKAKTAEKKDPPGGPPSKKR